MARSSKDQSIKIKNDATCITNRKSKARKAKTKSNKTDRQFLKKEMNNEANDTTAV